MWFHKVSQANNDTKEIATEETLLKDFDMLMVNGRNSPAIERNKKKNTYYTQNR